MTTTNTLIGKVALVTGSAGGMGRAYAHHLASLGADIVIADLDLGAGRRWGEVKDSVEAEITAMGRRAVSIEGDLSDPSVCERAVERAMGAFGRLDILVNNAGGAITPIERSTATSSPAEDTDRLMKANFFTALHMSRAAAPALTRPDGSIVNIVTFGMLARAATGSYAIYTAAKAAVHDLTKSLALELGPDGIRVNSVAPGLIRTARVIATAAERGIGTGSQDAKVPLRRLGTPEDMLGTIEFFATDMSKYVTGQLVAVDGGVSHVSAL